MKTLVNITLVALASTAMMPAHAEQPAPTRMVAYHDLDLATDAGRKNLERRIDHAASSLCTAVAAGESLKLQAYMYCRTAATRGARPQLELAFDQAHKGAVQVAAAGSGAAIRVAAGR